MHREFISSVLMIIVPLGAAMVPGCARALPRTTAARREGTRVVALAPAITQTLTAAGRNGIIVGRHAFDPWADASLPVCGDQSGIDYEGLLRVEPTHVLLQWGARPVPPRLAALAKSRGWSIVSYPLLSLDEVFRGADQLHADFRGIGEKPSATLEAALASTRVSGDTAARLGRVLLLYSSSPPTALGPGSYHHDLLVRLGAHPALASGAPFVTMDAEEVIRLAPDAIILIQPLDSESEKRSRRPSARGLNTDEVRARLAALDTPLIPAVAHGRVAIIDDSRALLPGPSLAEVARGMGGILRSWAAEE